MKLKSLCVAMVVSGALLTTHAYGQALVRAQNMGNGVFHVYANGLVDVLTVSCMVTLDPSVIERLVPLNGELGSWVFIPPINNGTGKHLLQMRSSEPVSGTDLVATITLKSSLREPVIMCDPITSTAQNDSMKTGGSSDSSDGIKKTNDSTGTSAEPKTMVTDEGIYANKPLQDGNLMHLPGTVNLGAGSSPVSTETPESLAPGEINDPGDQPLPPEAPEPEGDVDQPADDQGAVQPKVAPQQEKYISYKGILTRFKEYTDEKSLKAFEGLFREPVAATIRQEPALFINDGKSLLKVIIDVDSSETSAPNFALRGARLTSLKKDGNNRWVVEAVPEAGRFEATLTIVNGERMVDFPLTIAPPVDVNIDKKGVVTDADFSLFLSQRGTENAPAFDLNGDGKRDYVDDYLFTANYLAVTSQKK
ncbi:MAG: hypothetical protein ED859_04990 [Desulfuromonadales bacterium]|nr:MAG: hypothetical protein ED859_04990 [Desulfuromonadales bacterium]